MKKFLVVVDTQFDFVMPNGALYVKGAEQIIVPGINFLANLNPDEYEGVLFTYDSHVPDIYNGSPESEQFPIHCVQGTPGWENVFNPALIPNKIKTWTLNKGVFNMWEEEDLVAYDRNSSLTSKITTSRDYLFDNMSKDITIQVMGVASDYCVKQAVDGFVARGFKVNVIQELCKGIALEADFVFDGIAYNNVKLV